MKAVLALVIIYIGTFFLVIQGASQNPVQASPQGNSSAAPSNVMDATKETDIRSLMELVGARDLVQDGASNAIEQTREKLLATVPNNEKGQAFVNAFVDAYQKRVDVDQVNDQLVDVYDKHFTDDEIKSLLEFYGSPLGQKVASEMPKISREIQTQSRTAGAKAAKEALQALKEENPEAGHSVRLGFGQRRLQQRGQVQQQAQSQLDPR